MPQDAGWTFEVDGYTKILVVDDEEAVRNVTVAMLQRLGFEASSVEDGEHALLRVADEEFDLVLLDVVMPKMSGAETFAALRALSPRLPVLFMSGYSHKELVGLIDGARDVLAKPFPMGSLKHAVEKVLQAA